MEQGTANGGVKEIREVIEVKEVKAISLSANLSFKHSLTTFTTLCNLASIDTCNFAPR